MSQITTVLKCDKRLELWHFTKKKKTKKKKKKKKKHTHTHKNKNGVLTCPKLLMFWHITNDWYSDMLQITGILKCHKRLEFWHVTIKLVFWHDGWCFDISQMTGHKCLVLFVFVLRFYGLVNPMGSCRARSVYLTTSLLGRLSPLSG